MIFDWLYKYRIRRLIRNIGEANDVIKAACYDPKLKGYIRLYRDDLLFELKNKLAETYNWYEEENYDEL